MQPCDLKKNNQRRSLRKCSGVGQFSCVSIVLSSQNPRLASVLFLDFRSTRSLISEFPVRRSWNLPCSWAGARLIVFLSVIQKSGRKEEQDFLLYQQSVAGQHCRTTREQKEGSKLLTRSFIVIITYLAFTYSKCWSLEVICSALKASRVPQNTVL